MAELLFWPALIAYGEAAVAYIGNVKRPGRLGTAATWGVRLGWLAQSALLVAQAVRAEGFPWGTWAGSLNLFVWLVVGAYLVWGCRTPFRLLGLLVMPFAAALLLLAWAGGGAGEGEPSRYSDLFLVLHVGFVLAAFAGFTLAAALSGLYLWQDRMLKRRETSTILRLRVPSLAALDSIAARTITVALPALTLGIAAGAARILGQGGGFDALMAFTLVTWVLYGAYLLLRVTADWRGRRAAVLALLGFALVVLVRVALPTTHFAG